MNDDILPTDLIAALSRAMLDRLNSDRKDDTATYYMAGAADAVMFLAANIVTPNFQQVLDAIRADWEAQR